MGTDQADNRTPLEQAADFLARLQGDDASDADLLAFETWLSASPENWAAYDRLELLSSEIDARAAEALEALRAPTVAPRSPRPRPARWSRWAVAGAMAAAAAVAAWIWLPGTVAPQVYEADRGQIREVALGEGTRITLNTQSKIEVAMERRARRVVMSEGEAAFDVAQDPRRPFLITVGDRTVTVVGTEFNIANRTGRLSVTVTRGVVEVSPLAGEQGDVVRLVRSQRLLHDVGGAAQRVETVAAPENAFSWKKRRLIYDDASLDQVVADLNRYFPRPVQLEGDAKTLRFSGVLMVADEDAVLRRLEELLPVTVNSSADRVVLRRRRTD
ncbi:MAG: hypothetical protein B7Y99_07480 [Caulobacterales bacterium 32-69-10]|nr:MAG: hypothetical protein B7Y99_07480 [Caulobacterales bacterium 32-69-10]